MTRPLPRRFTLLVVTMCTVIFGAIGLPPSSASAHNSLLSSDPADGTALPVAPAQITWTFDNAVPLETLTVTLIDVAGVRSELSGSMHGPTGETEVITPLPSLEPASVSVRWRLVGADGHAVSGRVDFTIAPATPTTAAATASTSPPANPASVDDASVDRGDDSYSTSSLVSWILRYASYLAIMAVVGVLLTSAYVWTGAGHHPILRRLLSRSLFATAGLGFLQLLVIASDISGEAPWSSFGSIDAATTTDAGMAFAIRIALAVSMWLVLFHTDIVHRDVYWTAVSLPGLGLLATWAFAGHSRSMRSPVVGVVTDVAHHAAAAAGIAGLAIVGWMIIPKTPPDVLEPAVRRSHGWQRSASQCSSPPVSSRPRASPAARSTCSTHTTGALSRRSSSSSQRCSASPMPTAAGSTNASTMRRPSTVTPALRQAVLAEFAIGLIVIAIAAAMVVSPPSSGQTETGAPTGARAAYILHPVVALSERPT